MENKTIPVGEEAAVVGSDSSKEGDDKLLGVDEVLSNEEKNNEQQLSKRAKKRLIKREKWLQYRPIKRAKNKERMKKKREEAKLNNISLGPSRKVLKSCKMSTSKCKIRVILDFSFDSFMNEKEVQKCVNQLNRCYSNNRRTENPLQMYVTSFNSRSKDVIQKYSGYTNWDVNFHEEKYIDIFKKEELVYLTGDSDNVINEFDENKAYVIGALVDHNSQKGLCLRIANEQGIHHGRLPISQHLEMKTRQILTVDQVFSIILNVASCGLSWKDAFLNVLPQRKGAVAKLNSAEEENGTNEENTQISNSVVIKQ